MQDNITLQNENFWDNEALAKRPWSVPVSSEIVDAAIKGNWDIHVTKKPIPSTWLPKDIKGKNILCLASAGGQQAPVLAAAGANVTVFDLSNEQLAQDEFVAKRDGLKLTALQGDMRDLSKLNNDMFDFIIHPISNLYVPNISAVWKESYRVLKKNGILISSFYNPILFVFERNRNLESEGLIKPSYSIPYSDKTSLNKEAYNQKLVNGEAIVFGHSLEEQINGQIEAGIVIGGFYEDEHPTPRFLLEKYMSTMIATKAIKL